MCTVSIQMHTVNGFFHGTQAEINTITIFG